MAALSAASSRLRAMYIVVYVTMLVVHCLKESTTVSLAKEVKSTVTVGSLVGMMEWSVRRMIFLIDGLDIGLGSLCFDKDEVHVEWL